MAEFFECITDKMAEFIKEQPLFFVASACAEGRVNVSPKGMDTFRILGPTLCGYLDLTGSGNETAAHIKNDGRLTFMFNSFGRQALIIRLFGQGRVLRPSHSEFNQYAAQFPVMHGCRQIILMDVSSTQTSCGYTVPQMELVAERQSLMKWSAGKSDAELQEYRNIKNTKSIDGLDTGLND
ncbi:pyridoxamine 5'-phosphate oxidase family protein [Kordiimonas pumila]|uniref:Pyridoxamine 5'-phosphate oxidase family protein n=1 Tax=Kordiimonas pumila TaxID=2161677 RepID=A0ABV7D913_9PROT|nr:pyridoxamine 5'-phosphate oxidase family protein [Kordiimonas pumila]